MTIDAFFNQLSNQFKANLPYVGYRKPNEVAIKALLQKNDTLFFTETFTESGFVFSPFNSEENSVIFPLNESESIASNGKLELLKKEEEVTVSEVTQAKENHINLVKKAIEEIENGSFKKVVLSRVEVQDFNSKETLQLFKKLLVNYKTAMVYCWFHPKVGLWLGATPETLLKVEGKRLQTMSLAGTQPFVHNAEVVWKAKEIQEQQLVTDFIVNSLQSSLGSLSVGKPETVKAGDLLHLKTKISGVLSDENNFKNVLNNLHPTPAVCGLPKAVTKTFILKNEPYNREFYTGFLGELNLKQSKTRNTNRRNVENNAYGSLKTVSHLFVNLRCLQIKDNQALIYVGGGITKDSNLESEWEETVAKSKTVKNLL